VLSQLADEAQIIYEYVNGSDVSIRSNDLKITPNRLHVQETVRPDGKIYVDDPAIVQRVFTGTGVIVGADANELHDVQIASITFDGTYPRIKKIYWTGAIFEENIPVSGHFVFSDMGFGFWGVDFTLREYTA